ncbi:unnamed protein product [Brassica oleracea]
MRRRVISKELEHGSYPCTCDILCIASVVLQPNTAFELLAMVVGTEQVKALRRKKLPGEDCDPSYICSSRLSPSPSLVTVYEEYMQEQKEKKNLPGVCFKKPKKILKKRDHVPSQIALNEATTVLVNAKKTWNMRMVDQSEKCKESVMESKKEEEAIELKVKKARFCFCKKQRKDCGRKITVSPTTLV